MNCPEADTRLLTDAEARDASLALANKNIPMLELILRDCALRHLRPRIPPLGPIDLPRNRTTDFFAKCIVRQLACRDPLAYLHISPLGPLGLTVKTEICCEISCALQTALADTPFSGDHHYALIQSIRHASVPPHIIEQHPAIAERSLLGLPQEDIEEAQLAILRQSRERLAFEILLHHPEASDELIDACKSFHRSHSSGLANFEDDQRILLAELQENTPAADLLCSWLAELSQQCPPNAKPQIVFQATQARIESRLIEPQATIAIDKKHKPGL